jgi:hypothetical protein
MVQLAETEFVVPEVAERIDAVGLSPGPAGLSSSPQEIIISTAARAINGTSHFVFFICENSPLNYSVLYMS